MLGRLAASLLAVAAACGTGASDVNPEASARQPQSLQVPSASAAGPGCGRLADTDESAMAANRPVARCAPEMPDPQPLPGSEPTTVRIGVRARTEDLGPLLLAEHLGELDKENVRLEIVELTQPAELYAALAYGAIDAVAGNLDAPFFDLANQGSRARLVLGGPIAAHPYDRGVPQAGLWLRGDLLDGDEEDWRDLENQAVAVDQGISDAAAYPIHNTVMDHDLSLNEFRLVLEGGRDAADGLLAGDLAGAWLTDPYWRPVAADGGFELIVTLPAAESLSGLIFSPRLLDARQDRATGMAVCRAVIRTINTYLAGDYQEDDQVVDALAESTGLSEDDIVHTPAWVFDWEVRADTVERIQLQLVPLGGVIYEEEMMDSQLVDRSLYEEVITRQRAT